MDKVIYLCGGIKDLSVEQQTVWRNKATEELSNFKTLDPMRRNFRDSEFQSQNEIVSLDKKDIIECDILLVNATKPSWVTAIEIMFGLDRHKIIVAFTGDNYQKVSPWVAFHSTRVCKTLEEAIAYIKQHFE